MTDPLFAPPSASTSKAFGQTYNGKYHMPLLPGEEGTKSGGDWVPYGIQRMTNLCGAFEDTRALSVWEQALGLAGLALEPQLYAELLVLIRQAELDGVVFERMRDYPELKEALAGAPHDQRKQELSIIGRAKKAAGAHLAAARGTAQHDAWEWRAVTAELSTDEHLAQRTIDTEVLLDKAGLVRVPGLQERVVRNVRFGAVGKFDDVLMEESTGRLLMADLKSKARSFYSYMSVDAQLAGYATAEWMLTEDGQGYEPGPLHHVDQIEGVIMHVPSDGSPAYLRRADLVNGRDVLEVARRNIELRAYGKSCERLALAEWVPAHERQDS